MDGFRKDIQYYKFCAYGFLKNLRFFEPFLILFFLEGNLSYLQIGVIYTIREVIRNIFEIPSGLAADVLGRRRTMITSFSLYIISFLYGIGWIANYQNAGFLAGFLMVLTNQYNGLYHGWRGRSLFQGSIILIKSWLLVWAVLIIITFVLKTSAQYSRFVFGAWFLITPLALIFYRLLLRYILVAFYKKDLFIKNAAIYGTGTSSDQLFQIFHCPANF